MNVFVWSILFLLISQLSSLLGIAFPFANMLQQLQMSIYSGFATRFQEQAYDHCIDSLLYVMQKRLLKFYQGEQADQAKFLSVVIKLHQQLRNMEKSKYLDPKSSQSISELIKFLQFNEQNIVFISQKDPSAPAANQHTLSIQAPKAVEQQSPQKKKVSYWVQKVSKVEDASIKQQQQKEESAQKKGKFKQQSYNHKKSDTTTQFKRTSFNNPSFTVKHKNASKLNLSSDKQPLLVGLQAKPEQNRSVSGQLNENHHSAYSRVSFKNAPQEEVINARKRKIKSFNKSVNQIELQNVGARNEISDIIKDYIIKTKRSKKVLSRNSKHKMEYLGKMNDF